MADVPVGLQEACTDACRHFFRCRATVQAFHSPDTETADAFPTRTAAAKTCGECHPTTGLLLNRLRASHPRAGRACPLEGTDSNELEGQTSDLVVHALAPSTYTKGFTNRAKALEGDGSLY